VGAEFRAALAIGGLDGTLRSRFAEEEQVGRVRGKTGSLNGVHCLTGYVDGADGEVYAFAFLVNDIRGPLSRARRLHDRFVEVLLEIGGEFDLAAVVEDGQEDTGE
jgi:D-alanyl-D-alanine carboxypeptidase/D-alanyl-D-alanine-endopeptidase (penicillin-binding protein 4)